MNEEQKAAATEQLNRDRAEALKLQDIARFYLDTGMSPKYVAHNFGFPLGRCLDYLRRKDEQKAAKAERARATGGGGDL